MPLHDVKKYPERFIELKKSIIGDEAKVTQAWADLLAALKDATVEYASKGPAMIPIVEFDQLETLGMFTFSQGSQMQVLRNLPKQSRTPHGAGLVEIHTIHF